MYVDKRRSMHNRIYNTAKSANLKNEEHKIQAALNFWQFSLMCEMTGVLQVFPTSLVISSVRESSSCYLDEILVMKTSFITNLRQNPAVLHQHRDK